MLGVRPKAAQHLSDAEAATVTPRERGHSAALRAWLAGDLTGALRRWEDILAECPRDMLALRVAHAFHFDLGDSAGLRDSVARVLPAWPPESPGYGYVLGMHAFGLEECGDYAATEAASRRAIAIDPEDAWSVHAVAHVMEMQGRRREGIDWLRGLEASWTKCTFFVHQVWWHLALFHLERDAALAVYDDHVRDDFSDIALDIIDAASLLWRLELVDVGGRWIELADKAELHIGDRAYAFADAHFMMCLAAGGCRDAQDALLAGARAFAVERDATQAPIVHQVGVPLCEALAAFRAGEYERTVELLMPLRDDIRRLGGSHAQRDVFAHTVIAAALKCGRFDLARDLLAERTAFKPNSAPSWRLYARALDGLGARQRPTRPAPGQPSCQPAEPPACEFQNRLLSLFLSAMN